MNFGRPEAGPGVCNDNVGRSLVRVDAAHLAMQPILSVSNTAFADTFGRNLAALRPVAGLATCKEGWLPKRRGG